MALSCAAAVPFVYFMCPEVQVFPTMARKFDLADLFSQTTGRTLEEIDLIFAKDSVKQSDWAIEVLAHHEVSEKSPVAEVEKV